jgi:regulator of nucleoside diphosphate kinase
MSTVLRNRSVPNIVVGDADHDRLTSLATAALERVPEVAAELLSEMGRAHIVPDGSVPANVVRMGSRMTFRSDDGRERTATLVYPVDEDSTAHKLSIMTPVGAALIGLAESQSISWTARDGRRHELTVVKVDQP